MESISVHVLFEARPGSGNAAEKVLVQLQECSRKDPGCLQYDMHRHPENRDQFMLFERWESREMLDAHLKLAHLAEFENVVKDLLAREPQISFWQPV